MAAPTSGLVVITTDELKVLVREQVDAALADRRPMVEPAPWLSTPQLAEHFGCSRAKIHKLAERGDLPFVWLGDERRFDACACAEALQKLGRVAK